MTPSIDKVEFHQYCYAIFLGKQLKYLKTSSPEQFGNETTFVTKRSIPGVFGFRSFVDQKCVFISPGTI